MTMRLLVISEFAEIIKNFGKFYKTDLSTVIKRATDLNLTCLSFISCDFDNYFNEQQMQYLKKEIEVIRKCKLNETEKHILTSIEQAIPLALEEGLLKLEIL